MDSSQKTQSDAAYQPVPTEPPMKEAYPVQSGGGYGQPMQYQEQQQPPPQYVPQGGAYYCPVGTGQPVVTGQPQYAAGQPVVVMAAAPQERFVCEIVLACFVFWCCGWLCGLVAFILAVIAQSKPASEANSARCLGRTSVAFSIGGIVLTVLIVAVYLLYFYVFIGQVMDELAKNNGTTILFEGSLNKLSSSLREERCKQNFGDDEGSGSTGKSESWRTFCKDQ